MCSSDLAWNAGVFSMIRQLSETVILPIAGLVLALVLYCLFYLAIAALHKIRRQERPPESYPFAPFLAAGFFTAYII